MRVFGQAVEGHEQQMTRFMSDVADQVVGKIKTYIDERLAVFENRKRQGPPF